MTTAKQSQEDGAAAPAVGIPLDRSVRALGARELVEQLIACHDEPTCPAVALAREWLRGEMNERRTDAQEARRLKKALRELSDAVLVFLHWMDNTVGPNKEIPRELSTKLGKACTFLDLRNDCARRFQLGLSITANAKLRAAQELRKLGAL